MELSYLRVRNCTPSNFKGNPVVSQPLMTTQGLRGVVLDRQLPLGQSKKVISPRTRFTFVEQAVFLSHVLESIQAFTL